MTQDDPQVTVGVVVAANDRGFQLAGRESWCNWSKWAPEPKLFPSPGDHIVASLDRDGFVRRVVLGNGPIAREAVKQREPKRLVEAVPPEQMTPYEPSSARSVAAARNPQLDREFRLRCLQVAIDSFSALAESAADFELATLRATLIAAWAEGRDA